MNKLVYNIFILLSFYNYRNVLMLNSYKLNFENQITIKNVLTDITRHIIFKICYNHVNIYKFKNVQRVSSK